MSEPLPHPGVRFPPPFLFVAAFLAGLGLERVWPSGGFAASARPLFAAAGWLAGVLGLLLIGWAVASFVRARTAMIPHKPASRLVITGPYRVTRNPMYTGLTLLYVGLALVFAVWWPLLFLPLAMWSLYALVIQREERYLAGAFGEEYAAYRRRVRRWI